jgi:histidine triad (HIT) family protein
MSERGCPFCLIAAGETPARVVLSEPAVLAFLDRRPLFSGHILVVPRIHAVTLADLPLDLVSPLFDAVRLLSRVVEVALGAEGSFVAVNNRVSQSVAHLHVHVVPRRKGDGLKGFFWPRHPYPDEETAAQVEKDLRTAAARLRREGW